LTATKTLYQTLRLWDHIYGDERGILEICYVKRTSSEGRPTPFSSVSFRYPEDAQEAADTVALYSEDGYDVWHCAHLLTGRRKKENAAPVAALYADGDGAQVPEGIPQPTAVVRSSPGRHQYYWRLSMPVPPNVGENLNRRLAYAVGADKSGWDLTQLLRPPGTRNHKYDDVPLVELEDLGNDVYDAADLDRLLPTLPETTGNGRRLDNTVDDEPPVALGPEALKVWRGERFKAKDDGTVDRSTSLVKIGRVLYDAGASGAVVAAALKERDLALGWECYTHRRDADKQYQNIVDVLAREGRTQNIPINLNGSDHKAASKPSSGTPTHDELRDRWISDSPYYAHGLGDWRRYEAGTWPTVPETSVKAEISGVIEDAKPEGIKPTASILASVTELTRIRIFVPDERWDADSDILVCKNGALHISTGELEPHRPEHYATSAVPYEYRPKARTVGWDHFISNTLPVAAAFLQEFAGYALTTDMSHELAVWLYGPPGSGKSTFLAGLQAMLGHRAGILGLADLERSRFTLADLPGKTLVVASEQPSSYLASTNALNAIISGEPLQVERKYRDPFTVTPRAKVCWAMNELPRVADANSGLFRRVKVVAFPELSENQRDPEVKRLIEAEGAGILNWALEGLDRLNRRGRFEIPEGVLDATKQFRERNDVPALFVEDRCTRGTDFEVQAARLYREYKYWCDENGHRPQSSTRVADDWRRLGLERRRTKSGTVYRGLRVKEAGE
jgi:P4 family phage/plasmid primase-like protien